MFAFLRSVAFGVVPFLKDILGRMLPMMGMAKQDNLKWVIANCKFFNLKKAMLFFPALQKSYIFHSYHFHECKSSVFLSDIVGVCGTTLERSPPKYVEVLVGEKRSTLSPSDEVPGIWTWHFYSCCCNNMLPTAFDQQLSNSLTHWIHLLSETFFCNEAT